MQLKNLPNSSLRVISGLLIGIGCILVSISPSAFIMIFLALLLLLCSYELSTFFAQASRISRQSVFVLSLIGGVIGFFNPIGDWLSYLVVIQCIAYVVFLYFPRLTLSNTQLIFGSLIYPGMCLGILANYMVDVTESYPVLLLYFTLIWSSDVGAYYFGKNFGKRKLLENVSPKKTIEGLLGGGLVALVCSLIWAYSCIDIDTFGVILLGIITWLACSYGDLVQSKIKRTFGVKDSSNLIPGHGGYFDRFDGFIFAGPFFVITHYLAV